MTGDAEISRIDEQINRKQAELQELENLLQERQNQRISNENEEMRRQIERERSAFESERTTMLGVNEKLKTQAENTAREMQELLARESTGSSEEERNAAEQALEVARNTVAEASVRADALRRFFLVLSQLEIENCVGVAGARLSRFLTVRDEPAIKLNDRKIWPEGTQSLKCPGVYEIERQELQLDRQQNEIIVYETNETGGNPREMGTITTAELNEAMTCQDAVSASSGGLEITDGWCTSTFSALDGVYKLRWRIEAD